ncbi:GerMN domain-containing protein [Sedimentibacter saalensis]|uniref:Sporulation and spore germination protein n=2 Tax=root TaxID=1 RepID=A0A562JF76_9FIRM|nr:GerMN domain-containing protein [Sedimentibacter saalensis]TWH81454.1 sporulation and spore germination protein [Sedimentibacter saalensis]
MNKIITMVIISAMLFTGCANEANPPDDNNETPSLKIENYYPFTENTKYVYEGEGNEFAFMTTYVDYIKDNRIQTRTDNGGTEIVKVLEIKDGQLLELLNRGETYFRENFTDEEYTSGRILLKEPLEEGNSWTNDSGATSTITNVAKEIVTKMGNFEALEVTTEGKQGKTIDYYAKDTGLIKTVNIGEGYEVSSTISEIIKNQPFIQSITLYYPDVDGITIHAVDVQISFNTNEEPKDIIEKNVKDLSVYEVLGPNTKINDLYFDEQGNSVHIDLSKEFVTEMNAGSGFEAMILQCLTNTLGDYYQVEEVYITIDGGPYESGHIIIEEGEAYKVDYTNVKTTE